MPHGPTTVQSQTATIALPSVGDDKPREYPGIHNAVAYHEGFVSGSAPEGDAGFKTLAAMGVKTIISVDGAEPEVERAKAVGIRYIHLPIGYNGFDEQRKLQLVRATRDAMNQGPVYIHCHHGKHRSAGAAATIAASLGWLSPELGVERMHVSGTAANYTGLYACASGATVLVSSEIDRVPADFPSVWKPSGYVKGMVEIDEVFEHLKTIEKAAWKTPADHPDLVPAAEAGRLADLFRVLSETDYVARKPAELALMMHEANVKAQALENLIVGGEANEAKLGAQFKLVTASCKDCHTKYRD
ncbi:MAG: hypothetical protein U1D55_00195 [Phycisphaerae bacterium]